MQAEERPRAHRVAVILVNYNSAEHTLACVDSIRRHTGPGLDYQIVVVDNASDPADRATLAPLTELPGVQVVVSRRNTGFSGGNMAGVEHADADYYYFLNNDCLLEEDALSALAGYLDAHGEIALASGLRRHEDGNTRRNLHYHPSLLRLVLGTGIARWLRPERHPDKHGPIDGPLRVPVLSGCSMFVRATAFEAIGGFDTNHFLYCEEEDLSRRLAQHGGFAALIPGAGFVHAGSASTPTSEAYLKEWHISHLYYVEKHHGRFAGGLFRLALLFKLLPKSARLALFVLRGAPMGESLRHAQVLQPKDTAFPAAGWIEPRPERSSSERGAPVRDSSAG